MAVNPSAYQLLMNGLRNTFAPVAPAGASIYDQARADAQRQALAQLGMGLVGAAVPQTAAMRAQALQNTFAGMGNMGTNIYNAAQIRLAEQKALQDQQAEAKVADALSGVYSGQPQSGPRQITVTPATGTVMDGGYQRAANVSPVQETLVRPLPPSATITGQLTQAQIDLVKKIEASEGKAAALKKAAELQYENSQPRKPLSEVGQTVADLEAMGESPDVIASVREAMLFGKPDGVLAILTDPRWKKPEFSSVRQALIDAEVAKLKGQGQPEFLKLVEAYRTMPEGNEKNLLRAKLEKEAAPNGMRLEFNEQGMLTGIVQGDAPAGASADERAFMPIFWKKADEELAAANAAVAEITTNNELRGIIENGVKFGKVNEAFNAVNTELVNLGLANSDDAAINTKLFAIASAKKVTDLLSSGALGTGVSITEKDVQFMREMAVADPANVTPEQVLRIFDIQEKLARKRIERYQQRYGNPIKKIREKAGDSVYGIALESYDIQAPEAYEPPAIYDPNNPSGQ